MRKVAIMGKCSSTRSDAPIHDPSWEIWTLGWDPMPVCHRTFDIHRNWRQFRGNDEDAAMHRATLIGHKVPVYMLEAEADVPNSVRYPMEDVADVVGLTNRGTPYLESSIAYMLALAILELKSGDRIGIWGVDMAASTEYIYQRANCEYLVGLARGKGIKVFIPPQSALLTHAQGVAYGFWTAEQAAANEQRRAA